MHLLCRSFQEAPHSAVCVGFSPDSPLSEMTIQSRVFSTFVGYVKPCSRLAWANVTASVSKKAAASFTYVKSLSNLHCV